MPPNRPRQFDLIAFDWDGTLFDSTGIITRCIQAAVVDVGGARPTDQAASYVIGMGLSRPLPMRPPMYLLRCTQSWVRATGTITRCTRTTSACSTGCCPC